MYAYALATPTFTTAGGHYSRLSSPIARAARLHAESRRGWLVIHFRRVSAYNLARPGTSWSEFAFSSPCFPYPSRGLIIPDRYLLIYENGGPAADALSLCSAHIPGIRVSSLFLPRFASPPRVNDDTLGDVYRDIETYKGWHRVMRFCGRLALARWSNGFCRDCVGHWGW